MSAIYRLIKYATSAQDERDATKNASFSAGFYGHFPTSMGMYYVGAGADYKSQRFYLGTEDDGALYALTFHDAYGSHQMTLYPAKEYVPPLMALASNEKKIGSTAMIALPPATASSESGDRHRVERLKPNFQGTAHSFTIGVGEGTASRSETFEWRDDKKPKPKVRRLTRMDRQEVVAIWKEGSVPNRQGRLATFEFLGSGATGELGDYWALMAVASALRVCQSQWGALAGSQVQSAEKYISWHSDETGTKKTNTEPFWSYGPAAPAKMTDAASSNSIGGTQGNQ